VTENEIATQVVDAAFKLINFDTELIKDGIARVVNKL